MEQYDLSFNLPNIQFDEHHDDMTDDPFTVDLQEKIKADGPFTVDPPKKIKVKTGHDITDVPPEVLAIIAEFMMGDKNKSGNFFEKYKIIFPLFKVNRLFLSYLNDYKLGYVREVFKNDIAVITKLPPADFPLISRIRLYVERMPRLITWDRRLPMVNHVEFATENHNSSNIENTIDISNIIFNENITSVSLDVGYNTDLFLNKINRRKINETNVRYNGKKISNLKITFPKYTKIPPDTINVIKKLVSFEIKLDLDFTATNNNIIQLFWLLNSNKISGLRLTLDNIGGDKINRLAITLNKNTSLTTLNLSDNKINDEFITLLLSNNTNFGNNLTELLLNSNKIGATGAAAIADALKHNTSLKHLNLRSNNIGSDGATAIADALKYNKSLKHLDLGYNNIEADGAAAVVKALMTNGTLKELILNNNIIGIDGAKAIAAALTNNTSLKRLDLDRNSIRADGANAIADAIETTKIIHLSLSSNFIKDTGATAIAEALKTNTTLLYLCLDDNSIDYDGAVAIAEALKVNTTLEHLMLADNSIRIVGGAAIADALKTNRSLTHLDLSNNDIGPMWYSPIMKSLTKHTFLRGLNKNNEDGFGVTAIGKALKTNRSLVYLNLKNNNIEYGIEAIAAALKVNTTLEHLDLSDNDIGNNAKAIAKALMTNRGLRVLDLGHSNIRNSSMAKFAEAIERNETLQFLNLSNTVRTNYDIINMVKDAASKRKSLKIKL